MVWKKITNTLHQCDAAGAVMCGIPEVLYRPDARAAQPGCGMIDQTDANSTADQWQE